VDGAMMTAIVTAVSGVIGSLITYLVTRSNNDKDIYLNDRENLSEGQEFLISQFQGMLDAQKEEMSEYKEELSILRLEIKNLQQQNLNLLIENRSLSEKITELTNRLNQD